jgi:HK97 family phage portal protein
MRITCITWGDKVQQTQKRGLFQTIFGKLKETVNPSRYARYRLLSSWDSQFSAFSGNAWDISTVRSAVDAFARNAAKITPRHILRTTERREDVKDSIDKLLQFKPNPYMTAYAFYYKIATQFCLYNNAFIFPVWDKDKLAALYPINASTVELVEKDGDMYARLIFSTGNTWICPYEDLIHLRKHFNNNDIFGDANKALCPVLDTANAFNQSMSKFAELISVIRGILKARTSTKDEDLHARREDFIQNNLRMDSNGSGIIVTDTKFDYTPINERQTPIPAGQLDFIRREIYDYIGVNDDIVQNKADSDTMEAFYRGGLSPFYLQLSQGFTNGLFTERERSAGHEILCEMDRLQFEKLTNRTEAAKFLTSVGALTLDQLLDLFGYPPIGGEEGSRRVQTLNMASAAIVDAYQLGKVDPVPAVDSVTGQDPPEDYNDAPDNKEEK